MQDMCKFTTKQTLIVTHKLNSSCIRKTVWNNSPIINPRWVWGLCPSGCSESQMKILKHWNIWEIIPVRKFAMFVGGEGQCMHPENIWHTLQINSLDAVSIKVGMHCSISNQGLRFRTILQGGQYCFSFRMSGPTSTVTQGFKQSNEHNETGL